MRKQAGALRCAGGGGLGRDVLIQGVPEKEIKEQTARQACQHKKTKKTERSGGCHVQYRDPAEGENEHRAWVVDESEVEICLGTAQTSLLILPAWLRSDSRREYLTEERRGGLRPGADSIGTAAVR